MELNNVKIKTSVRFEDDLAEVIDTLEIEIPLPGGMASYVLDLPKGVKGNLELASQLSKKIEA
jgi:hypothetical protein